MERISSSLLPLISKVSNRLLLCSKRRQCIASDFHFLRLGSLYRSIQPSSCDWLWLTLTYQHSALQLSSLVLHSWPVHWTCGAQQAHSVHNALWGALRIFCPLQESDTSLIGIVHPRPPYPGFDECIENGMPEPASQSPELPSATALPSWLSVYRPLRNSHLNACREEGIAERLLPDPKWKWI